MLPLLVIPGTAASETRPAYGGKVVAPLLGAPASLDPVLARTHADLTLVRLLFDTLYRVDDDGRAIPSLAASMPELSENQKTAFVAIRQDVRFHGGGLLSAKDVAASLERARKTDARWLFGNISRVRAKGGGVEFELKGPERLAILLAAPQTSVTRNGRPPRYGKVDGTGPFRLTAFRRRGREIRLRRHEEHFAGPPYIRTLFLRWFETPDGEARAYEAGDIHYSFRGAVAFAGHRPKFETQVLESNADVLVYVGFGKRQGPLLDDPDFRAAVSLSLNRMSFRNLGTGEGVVPSSLPVFSERTPRAALSARISDAKRRYRLVQSRHEEPDEFEIVVNRSRPDDREVAEKLSAGLFRLGLRSKIVALSSLEYAESVRTLKCDFFVGQLATFSPDPLAQIAAAFAAGRKMRDAGEVLRGWQASTANEEERFRKELPVLPLYYRSIRAHYRSNVYGFRFQSSSRLEYADLFVFGAPARAGAEKRK